MIWDEIKKQLVGVIVGALLTGATMMLTVNAKLDMLAVSFSEYKNYNDERYKDLKESLAKISFAKTADHERN